MYLCFHAVDTQIIIVYLKFDIYQNVFPQVTLMTSVLLDLVMTSLDFIVQVIRINKKEKKESCTQYKKSVTVIIKIK